MRSMKRIACVLLCVVLVVCSSGTCFAEVDENGFEHLSNGHILYNGEEYEPLDHNQALKELYSIVNKMGIFGAHFQFALDTSASLQILGGIAVRGNDGTLYFKVNRKSESGDDIVFSDDYVDSVYNSALDQIKEYDGYFFVPTTSFRFSNSYFYNSYTQTNNANFHSSIHDSDDYDFIWEYTSSSEKKSPFFADSNYYVPIPKGYNYYLDSVISVHSLNDVYSIKFARGATPSGDITSCYAVYGGSSWKSTSACVPRFYGYPENQIFYTDSNGLVCACFLYTKDGHSLKVWKDLNSMVNFYRSTGQQNFYTSETFNNYKTENDNSVTINKTVYENTDYETINNNEYNTINNTVNNYYETNGDIIDTSNIENLIKDFQEQQAQRDEELINKEQEIIDKTEESIEISKETNNKLDQIYEILLQLYDKISPNGSGSGDGSEFDMNTLIDMLNNLQLSLDTYGQYDLAQIRDNTRDIVNALKSSNPDSQSILQDIYTTQLEILELQKNYVEDNKNFFQSVLDYLKKIYDAIVLNGIIDNVKDLLSLDDELSVGEYIEDIMVETSELNQMVKVKFPTSIPWDVLALVRLLACEPQTPHFEIPVHFDLLGKKVEYEIVIDLEQFERVAIFGRGLLSILFSIWLLFITKRILYKDGD